MGVRFTEAQLDLRDLAKEFFEKEVRPVMAEIDARPDPKDCYPRDLVRKGSKIGFRTLAVPEEYGGGGADIVTRTLVYETMNEVEPGTAKIFSQCWKVSSLLVQACTEDQKKKFLKAFVEDDDYTGSLLLTEPNAGSDNVLPYNAPEAGIATTAVPDGNYYVLNGMKHYISLASFSKLLLVYARTDRKVGVRQGTTIFLVPGDYRGVSYGQVHNKMGWRLYPNGEVFFDKVRLPKEYMLGTLNSAFELSAIRSRGDIENPTAYLGMIKGMYKICLEHAKQRVQGGKPIIQHPTVGTMLAEMALVIDTLEAWVYDTAQAVKTDQKSVDPKKQSFGRIFSRDCTIKVILLAMDILGGLAIMRDHPMEKLIRDTLSNIHGGGTNSLLKLKVIPSLQK